MKKWSRRASIATVISVIIAALALIFSIWQSREPSEPASGAETTVGGDVNIEDTSDGSNIIIGDNNVISEDISSSDELFESVFYISFLKPLVINKSAIYFDEFSNNPEYRVLASANLDFVSNANIIIENINTGLSREYRVYEIHKERKIGTISAGTYRIKLFTHNELRFQEVINLDTHNIGEDGEWHYDMYVLDDFFDNAIITPISLGDQIDLIEYSVFGLYPEEATMFTMFETNFIDENGTFEGDFYLLPGHYTLYNAITSAVMEPIEFDVN